MMPTEKNVKTEIPFIRKRNGEEVTFDKLKIDDAIAKAIRNDSKEIEEEEELKKRAEEVGNMAAQKLLKIKDWSGNKGFVPTVEMIQDIVEESLMLNGLVKTARAYIIYREEHAKLRAERGIITEKLRKYIAGSSKYFHSPYNEIIFYSNYSRWDSDLGRRETWEETVDRFIKFMTKKLGKKISQTEVEDVRNAILNHDVQPSMRLLWSAGKTCELCNVWAYNCAYVAPSNWRDLGEIMYICLCGAGIGFSVEREVVDRFPVIEKQNEKKKVAKHIIPDNREGWADAFVLGCETWAKGEDIEFDFSSIRPEGTILKTSGGRSSGPGPLRDLLTFTKEKLLNLQGKKLQQIDLHDIICKIGLIVVAGGVRRSAMISLSDLDSQEMRHAKEGQFWVENAQRSMSNNSAVYNEQPTAVDFMEEFLSIAKSGTGERGIFNRGGLEKQLPERRWKKMKDQKFPGVNPCGEIVLRSKQFCNLSSIVVRPNDTLETLKKKIFVATLLGTYQASLTHFNYISPEWARNCRDEALLGVSITGYYDNKLIRDPKVLQTLRDETITVNKKYAKNFGINTATCITTIKPHGNSSQLAHVGSGMHPWYAPYYIRRIRLNRTNPIALLLRDAGVPWNPEIGYSATTATTWVFDFPVAAPRGAIMKDDVSAIELLEEWKKLKMNYVEHNPSVTIYVSDDEWLEVEHFIYKNWDIVGGLTFLPRSNHVYQLAPYEEITKEEYERLTAAMPDIDFAKIIYYEQDDRTTGAKELACASGVCSVDEAMAEEAQRQFEEGDNGYSGER